MTMDLDPLARTYRMTVEVTLAPLGDLDNPPTHADALDAVHTALVTANAHPGGFGDVPMPAIVESWTIGKPRRLREAVDGERGPGTLNAPERQDVERRAYAAEERNQAATREKYGS